MSITRPNPQRRREHGLSVILVAILIVVLFGFVGIAVDAGHVHTAAQQLQTAADAAALAAASKMREEAPSSDGTWSLTRQAAIDVAGQNLAAGDDVQLNSNFGNNASGDIVVGTWDSDSETFTPTTAGPTAVKVVARRTDSSEGGALSLVFGGLFGAADGQVARTAIASYQVTPNPFILVLHPSASKALDIGGDAALNVGDGTIQVNSSASCALEASGSSSLSCAETEVHGSACAATGTVNGSLKEYGDVYPDPLAGILPTTSDWTALRNSMSKPLGGNGKIGNSGTFLPGYYPKGLSLNNSQAAVLLPGTYMFGANWNQLGQSKVTGAGVTILMDQNAKMDLGGGASLILTPPLSGTFEGLSVMFHRLTSATDACTLGGNGIVSIEGTLYCPGGKVSIGGTGGGQVYGQIICSLLKVSGNGSVTGENVVPPSNSGSVVLVH